MIDGGEQNDRGCGGCFMNLPSQDAIAQFQTLDSNYSPDYGIGSGGTILMVLKSGTHELPRRTVRVQPQHRLQRQRLLPQVRRQAASEVPVEEPGGNIGGPLWIPHVYNENQNRTFFFWNEEWRRLIQGSSPSVTNAILANNFPTAGQSLALHRLPRDWLPSFRSPPIPPSSALYAADGLTPGQPFPDNVIPANLIDQNAVLS